MMETEVVVFGSRVSRLVVGLLSGGLAGYYYLQITEKVANVEIGNPQVGVGMYLCLGGALMLVVGGIAGMAKPKGW